MSKLSSMLNTIQEDINQLLNQPRTTKEQQQWKQFTKLTEYLFIIWMLITAAYILTQPQEPQCYIKIQNIAYPMNCTLMTEILNAQAAATPIPGQLSGLNVTLDYIQRNRTSPTSTRPYTR